ncbi:MAG TPA: hypothetical protein VGM88_12520 [Kofleriaceae bacterium]|jgi:hypothetical protein
MAKRAVCAIWLAAACGQTIVPPPQTPAREMPAMERPEAAPGHGTIAIATDEPASVEVVTGHVEAVSADGWPVNGTSYRTVCAATPCVASLKVGERDLRFRALDDPAHVNGIATVTIGEQPTNYHFAMGHSTDAKFHWVAPVIVGTAAVIIGLTLVGLGQTTKLDGSGDEVPGPDVRPAGIGVALGGAVLTGLGVWLASRSAGTSQVGAGVEW